MTGRAKRGYRSQVLDHFHHPRNAGVSQGHTHSYLEQDNPWGVRLLFTARVQEGHIQEVRFQARSCVTTTACASALTEMVWGKSLGYALSLTPEALSAYLGTVPEEKMYCCRLAVDTLHKALRTPGPAG